MNNNTAKYKKKHSAEYAFKALTFFFFSMVKVWLGPWGRVRVLENHKCWSNHRWNGGLARLYSRYDMISTAKLQLVGKLSGCAVTRVIALPPSPCIVCSSPTAGM